MGARVAQGYGPFSLTFNRHEQDPPTYLQIDGEAMKVQQIESLRISKNSLVGDGRIRVLRRRRGI